MRKIGTSLGVLFLVFGVVVSALLAYATILVHNFAFQTVLLLVSMALLFFSAHPLSHYVAARMYRVRVKYFFLGRSDFRRLGGTLGRAGKLLPTIGTKIDSDQIRKRSKNERAFVFGAGAIVSSAVILIPLIFAFTRHVHFVALVLGTLFFLGNIVIEAQFSTKVGDLAKMKKELS